MRHNGGFHYLNKVSMIWVMQEVLFSLSDSTAACTYLTGASSPIHDKFLSY